MATAYVLINSEMGLMNKVNETLKVIPEVKASYLVYGVHDIVAKIESDTTETLKEAVFTKIRQIDGVKTTLTMIVID
jgi:DNA-binding Lrp family transcriptional regulator